MTKKCVGCGVLLQVDDSTKKGFTKSLDMDYCMRCFRLNHYHDYGTNVIEVDSAKVIQKINEEAPFVCFFIDFLNLYDETIAYFKQIKKPKVLVVSKIDVLPREIPLTKIAHWLEQEYQITEKILFVQNTKTSALKMLDFLERKHISPLYFAGITNAGKSSLLNRILQVCEEKQPFITVSEMPNTTLDFLKIPLSNQQVLIDTPGLIYSYYKEDTSFLYKANVTKRILPQSFYLKPESILNLENKIFVKTNQQVPIVWFGSDKMKWQKVYKTEMTNWLQYEIKEAMQVFIKGVGFFYVKKPCVLSIGGVLKENVTLVKAFLGGNNDEQN